MKLDQRLLAVAQEVEGPSHADIGSDHAHLPLYLLNHKRCQKIVVTEKSPSAFMVAKQALWGRAADVRLGDGLEPIEKDEVKSVSLCGFGGSKIKKILEAFPDKVPETVIVQANRDSHLVRAWGLRCEYHIANEQLTSGERHYQVITFKRGKGFDPIYQDLDLDLALQFGPTLLKTRHPRLLENLAEYLAWHEKRPLSQGANRYRQALDFLCKDRGGVSRPFSFESDRY